MVEAEWEQIRQGELRLQQTDIDIIKSHFDQHAYDRNAVNDRSYEACLATDPAFSAFVKRNVRLHREDGYRIVFASLKPVGGVTGDISADRKSVVEGKSGSVRVALGGCRSIKKKKTKLYITD